MQFCSSPLERGMVTVAGERRKSSSVGERIVTSESRYRTREYAV